MTLISTKSFYNKKVFNSGGRKVGRLRAFVFHPKKPRVLGIMVKRPDVALMFHRRDLFVALEGLEFFDDGTVVIDADEFASGKAAQLALAEETSSLDECVIWVGMPVVNMEGETLGIAESVLFDQKTGDVSTLSLSAGATANTILGQREIPADLIKGYKEGAILVAAEAAAIEPTGGIAERAGAASAVAADKTKRAYKKVVRTVGDKVGEKVNEKIDTETLAEKVASAPEKGGFVVGRQVARAGGMFADFKRELDRGLKEDDDGGK